MSTINLSNILSELRSPAEMHKTAADKSCASSDTSSKDEPKAEEKNNDNSDNSENKGSDSEEKPSESLDKIASELAAMEHNTMIKEAQIFGSTMADSFATRMTEIQQVLDQEDTMNKTASYDQNDMEKIAADLYNNMDAESEQAVEGLVKVAAEEGINLSREEAFHVLAQDAVENGQNAAMEKVAADLYNNMDAESEQAVEGLVKVAAEEGINLSREEAFQTLAQEAAEAGQNAAMEKVASAEMYDTLDQAERASLQGFTKTAQAMGHDFDVLDSLTYLRNTELEKTAAKKEDDSTALGTGLGAGAGLLGGAGGAAALLNLPERETLKDIARRSWKEKSIGNVEKKYLKSLLGKHALKGGGALAGGLALGAGAGHLIDKYAAEDDSTVLGTGLGAGVGLAGGAGGAAALAGKEDRDLVKGILKSQWDKKGKGGKVLNKLHKDILSAVTKRNALKGGGALAGGLALGAGAGHLIDKYAADNSLDGELAEMEKMAADLTASGEMEKVAELENIAYELGFEDTLTKVASHVSGIGYEQTNNLLQNL